MFGSNFELKVHFKNAAGLTKGNNVRLSGIQVGTVKSVKFLNDSTIETVILISKKAKPYIHKNAVASIGNEGLMGNKIININPGKEISIEVEDGDTIGTKITFDTEEMMETLSKSNRNIAVISEGLKSTVQKINNSSALWGILNDKSLSVNLRASLNNISKASANANDMVKDIHGIIADIKNGKGSLGMLLTDTSFAFRLNETVANIKSVGDSAGKLANELIGLVKTIKEEVNNGKGTVNALLKDSLMSGRLNASLENIKSGTAAFNKNMEALKHNFLFRGYFRKLEKQKKKEAVNQK